MAWLTKLAVLFGSWLIRTIWEFKIFSSFGFGNFFPNLFCLYHFWARILGVKGSFNILGLLYMFMWKFIGWFYSNTSVPILGQWYRVERNEIILLITIYCYFGCYCNCINVFENWILQNERIYSNFGRKSPNCGELHFEDIT